MKQNIDTNRLPLILCFNWLVLCTSTFSCICFLNSLFHHLSIDTDTICWGWHGLIWCWLKLPFKVVLKHAMICMVYIWFGAFAQWKRFIVSLQYEPFFTRCKTECEAFLWSIKCHFLLMRVELIQCQCPNLHISKNLVFAPFFVKCRFVTSQVSQWLWVIGWIKRITNNKNVVCVISAIGVMGASSEIKACGFTLKSTPH